MILRQAELSSVGSTAAGGGPGKNKKSRTQGCYHPPKVPMICMGTLTPAQQPHHSSATQCSEQDGEMLVKRYRAATEVP